MWQKIISINLSNFLNLSIFVGDLIFLISRGIIEGESSDSFGFVQSSNFQAFNDTWNRFVFFTTVFSFGSFSDNDKINIVVLAFDSVVRFDKEKVQKSKILK